MVILACEVTLHLPGIRSLKEKRRIVKSILARISRENNVAVAEVAYHDIWQTAGIGLVFVGTNATLLHATAERIVAWIEDNRPDLRVEDVALVYH